MTAHVCTTSDGQRITCVCSTGRDHTDTEMDLDGPGTVADTVAEHQDRFVGMADQPAEDVVE